MPLSAETKSLPLHQSIFPALAYADMRVRWAVARARAAGLQPEDEFRGLYISDDQVDAILGADFGRTFGFATNGFHGDWLTALKKARRAAFSTDSPFTHLQKTFGLSEAELDILFMALLPEIDRRYERVYAYLQDDVTQKRPTVDLLLNLLTDQFEQKLRLRQTMREDSKLVRSRLLLLFSPRSIPEPSLLSHFVRPAPMLVAYLLGQPGLDSALENCTRLQWCDPIPHTDYLPSALNDHLDEEPIFSFLGSYGAGQIDAAEHIAATLNKPLLTLNLDLILDSAVEMVRLATRDALLLDAVLFINGWDLILTDGHPHAAILHQLLGCQQIIIVNGSLEWHAANKPSSRHIYLVKFDIPEFETRHSIWQRTVNDSGVDVAHLANHFKFTPGQIRDAVATARDFAAWDSAELNRTHLLAAGRAHSNQKLSELATKITPRYRWNDIILPSDTEEMLREMVNTVQNRPKVYGTWGFGKKIALGKGLNALFAGESGTGKTMAADILANTLGLDLYKIDLSTVVSKYIGETEKNLGKIFHEAETSNAVLFFDEADALFGKRSEVKDSHDRYANIETGYLLQRMEAFDGVVILATNLRANLDDAFTRRLHFIVEFPFPEPEDRERIWQANLPKETPLASDIDFNILAERFRIAGGSIRNIILAAAFLAAEDGSILSMQHLLHATRREYQKRGRLINEQLFLTEEELTS